MILRRLNHTLSESIHGVENINGTSVPEPESNSFFSFIGGNYGAFVGVVLALVVLLTVGFCVLNEFFRRKFGIDICRGQRLQTLRRRRNEALEAQRVADREREMEETEREQRKMERRRARRERYTSLLKNVTMTLQEEHFRLAEGSDHDKDLLIVVPPNGPNDKEIIFPAQCTICLSKYEVDDTVIWSTNSACQHCYHEECILMWLSTGKRRCPSCRQTFAESNEEDSSSGGQIDILDPAEPNVSDGEDDILVEIDEEECETYENEDITGIQLGSPPTQSISAESS
uniref:RING-type domain-containing protein n=1 Tax=Helicotheca tamesis TaxID=374047 RepID=A0A7S2MJL8_9STRA|mmetsp:Transcript_17145/g.23557  ORF Transcript_17145/g.23557 Transcript_17145/m.23557 type:complete len:286 (+) Transcript_17145:82-939(+)|eukprot:CAMPEP_0185728806 /NCGR_PEP_ID=MMETSP1171-20130828/4204_1 /TAXON_ID=374046 /ORGANISM="Helicotheca tamensis, Strain CCMP826" /LENGTH=285 /DNA_ID=CAMNT_0028397553 /DNA_START=67 /DNA_END=924 /DNA_ORIENTATION=+